MSKLRGDEVVLATGAAKSDQIVGAKVPEPSDTMKMDVAIYAAGVFYTEDGGRSWQPRNRGTRADFLPDRQSELGQCAHKLLPAAIGKRLYQQNHCDAHRSDSSHGWRNSARMIR
jgi:hypothetical protein